MITVYLIWGGWVALCLVSLLGIFHHITKLPLSGLILLILILTFTSLIDLMI